MREEVEGLRARVSSFDTLEYRLKQAESRLGGVLNELSAAKQAAKTVSEAPDAKQIADAVKSTAEWDALKEDFPEWADATDARLSASRAEILAKLPDITALRAEIQDESDARINAMRTEMLSAVVSTRHKGWQQTINQPDFTQWFEETKQSDSWDPAAVIETLDTFLDYKDGLKSPKDIKAERQSRLEAAQTQTRSNKIRPEKAEEELNAAELRDLLAKSVWGS